MFRLGEDQPSVMGTSVAKLGEVHHPACSIPVVVVVVDCFSLIFRGLIHCHMHFLYICCNELICMHCYVTYARSFSGKRHHNMMWRKTPLAPCGSV